MLNRKMEKSSLFTKLEKRRQIRFSFIVDAKNFLSCTTNVLFMKGMIFKKSGLIKKDFRGTKKFCQCRTQQN